VAAAALQLPVDVHHHPGTADLRSLTDAGREKGRRGARGEWRLLELGETCGAQKPMVGSGTEGRRGGEERLRVLGRGGKERVPMGGSWSLANEEEGFPVGPRNNCGK
jgi:hypothetical protein